MLGLLLTTCILLQTVISGSSDDPIYMVTVTSQTSGGGTEMLCTQILLLKEPLSIMVTLQTPGVSNTTILEESVTTKFQRCVQFQVPHVSTDTVAIVHASVQGEKTSLSGNTKILIKAISNVVTIIQTDKPIYKPGQRVMFRIVSLDAGLLPYSQMYKTVELQDPDSNRIAQWLNQSNSGGILDLSHPTTPEAKQGIYKITSWAEKGQKTIHTFEVKEYVLPKFEVTVHLPAVISDKDEEVTVKICGKYTYGKPVQGEIIAEICRRVSPGYWGGFQTGVCRKYTMRTDKAGCASENIDLKPFAVVSKETRSESTFDVECMITEDGTGVVLKGSGSRTFNHNRFCSEVEISAPTSFIPGKMVEGKIIVKGPRSSPIANMTVSYGVDISSAMSSENLTQLTTDSKGVAYFSLDTSAWEKDKIHTIEAHCPRGEKKINKVYSSPLDEKFVIDRHDMVSFYSKTKSFLKIKQADGALPCDKDAQIRIQYSIQGVELKDMQALDIFYLAQSKGGIVQHGSHEVRLSSGEAERGELSIPLQRMAELAPLVQVVVYMVLPNREVVADSRNLRVQLCFRNKVSLQFSSPQKLPGEKTFLEVQAEPGSLCSLRAIDQSVLLMKPEQELSAETIYENLPVQSLSDYPRAIRNNVCGRKKRYRPSKHMVLRNDVLSLFQDVGIKVLTNLEIKSPGCYLQTAYMSPVHHVVYLLSGPSEASQEGQPTVHPMQSPRETIRKFFPETWIWELIPVGDSGRAKVEHTVPDTITEWVGSGFCTSPAGFGLATNVGLTAFQPFFISLTLPYSVIRGEEFTLRATVFSYLSKCMMVEVRLADSAEFTAQPCTGCDYRRCVCGGASETFSWVLTPTSLGKVDIKVSAEALNTGELCDNEVVTVPERGQIDTVIRTLLVKPEGTEQTVSHNALLCPKEGPLEKVISLQLPEVLVEGSAKAFLSVLGDIMGRAMQNLDSLLAMPYGCGEQNMLRFAPNIYILGYLEKTRQLTPEMRSKAITYLQSGYQRELTYKHRDGSYSAFGESDSSGNTWLTAFVMKSFGGARPYIFIDPEHIANAKTWLSKQQHESGCIRSVGELFNNGMKGGVSDEVMLTAYVMAAFLELERNVNDPVVQKGLSCLKQAIDEIKNTYAIALLFYTFSLAEDQETRTLLIGQLDSVAKTTAKGRHWQHTDDSGIGSLEVETTSYVLLGLLSGSSLAGFDLGYSTSIVRWLVLQQNPYGGFSSTQDTVVALQALTLYAAASFSPEGSNTVTVSSVGGYKKQFTVDQHNRLLYQEQQLEEVPGVYTVRGEGDTCVFVQIALHYNIPPAPDTSAFIVDVEVTGNCDDRSKTSLTVTPLVRYVGRREETNMVIVNIPFLSGFILDESSLRELKMSTDVKRVDQKEDHLIVYLHSQKRGMSPRMIPLVIEEDVPVRNLKPAVVKVYDYYQTSDKAVAEYSSPCAKRD